MQRAIKTSVQLTIQSPNTLQVWELTTIKVALLIIVPNPFFKFCNFAKHLKILNSPALPYKIYSKTGPMWLAFI